MSRVQLALLLALLLGIFGLAAFAVRSSQQAHHPSYGERTEEADKGDRGKEDRKSFWEKTTDDPVAAFTAALVLFTAVLAGVSMIQVRFLIRADETSRIAAIAAKRSADTLDQTLVQTNKANVCVDRIVHNIFSSDEGVGGWSFYVIVKNTGNTPTDGLRVSSTVLIKDNGTENRQEFSQGGMIGARTDYLAPIHSVDITTMLRLHAREAEVFIEGFCCYKTVFS